MPQRVRIKTLIEVSHLPFPGVTITRDELGREEKLRYDYTSIRVDYDATWVGDTSSLDTYTQTVTDQP